MGLSFFRPTSGALDIKVPKPNLTAASRAVTPALLELTGDPAHGLAESPAVSLPLPRHRRGILLSPDGPHLLCTAKGRVQLNGRLSGWRPAGWYNLMGLGTAMHPHTVSTDCNSDPQRQASYSLL